MSPEKPSDAAPAENGTDLPFPDSLCHACAAPIKLIRTARSTFLYCPLFKRYPPQPVRACEKFTAKKGGGNSPGNS